jgi:hypothetical protein
MIVGIMGKAGSGKDTLGLYLQELFASEYKLSFYVTCFAKKLKELCVKQFNLNTEQLWGNDKEKPIIGLCKPQGVNGVLGREHKGISSNSNDYWSPREIMQEVGELYRRIDYNFWIKQLENDIKDTTNVVITDVRNASEVTYVKTGSIFSLTNCSENTSAYAVSGVIVKINRDNRKKIRNTEHVSETGLDEFIDYDIFVDNNGTLKDLRTAAHDVVDMIIKLNNLNSKGGIEYV